MNPLSIQLWTLNENVDKDFAGTIKEVAKIGYRAVELAGTGNLKPAEAARALKDNNVQVSGMHAGWDWLTDKYDELIANATLFQTREIICPGVDHRRYSSKAASLELGAELNQLGAKLRAAGFNFTYHNHDKEFAIYEGRPALEWMLEAAEPQNLNAEVDLYWVHAANQDPLKALHRLGARARLIHVKDGNGPKQGDVGKGALDFPSIFKFLDGAGIAEWYVIEQEEFPGPRLASVASAYAYMQGKGKS